MHRASPNVRDGWTAADRVVVRFGTFGSYNRAMSKVQTVESIEQAALQLRPEARAKLAHSLVESLGTLSRAQLEALWLDEVERRDDELESGKVRSIPGEEVFSRIESKYRK